MFGLTDYFLRSLFQVSLLKVKRQQLRPHHHRPIDRIALSSPCRDLQSSFISRSSSKEQGCWLGDLCGIHVPRDDGSSAARRYPRDRVAGSRRHIRSSVSVYSEVVEDPSPVHAGCDDVTLAGSCAVLVNGDARQERSQGVHEEEVWAVQSDAVDALEGCGVDLFHEGIVDSNGVRAIAQAEAPYIP